MNKKKTIKKKGPFRRKSFVNLAKLAKKIRESHERTQQDLADELGLHSQVISNVERAKNWYPDHCVTEFVYCYGVPKDRLRMALQHDSGIEIEKYLERVYSK